MRRLAVAAGTALFFGLVVVTLRNLPRSWSARVAVSGHSMEPTLADGDWLLVDPLAYRTQSPRAGDLVVSPDPRLPSRMLVKRVMYADADGYLALAGDHPAHRHVPGHQQPDQILVNVEAVIGRPWLRYWPFEHFGPVS